MRSMETLKSARPWLWALGLSLLVHGALLLPRDPAPARPGKPLAIATRFETRALPLPSVQPPPPTPPTPPTPIAPIAPKSPAQAQPAATTAQIAAIEAPAGDDPSPPTAIAPAVEWRYLLRQNGREGLARLSWQPQDGGYQLRLEREIEGRALPGWRSQGGLDGQGLAPQRYAQQRRSRQGWQDSQATNFRRDEGIISFSASPDQVALPAGVQDRISWWLQLAAIVAGAPQRFGPGSEIRLPVAGLRGEVHDWVFEVVGDEALALPNTVLASTLRLRRAALGPYDGGIEVWLDPARGHLPVRLIVGGLEGRGWELQLIDDDNGKP